MRLKLAQYRGLTACIVTQLDGCGAEEDVALWAALFNHSVRVMPNSRTAGGQPGIMIENCHNGQYTRGFGPPSAWPGNRNYPWSQNGSAGYNLRNIPYRTEANELICPYHMYRASTDIRPVWGSILVNLNSIPALAEARLSVPGCWAYRASFTVLRVCQLPLFTQNLCVQRTCLR